MKKDQEQGKDEEEGEVVDSKHPCRRMTQFMWWCRYSTLKKWYDKDIGNMRFENSNLKAAAKNSSRY